ncbi:DNA-3-methyladenine glycosylase family protein [Paenibacillus sp. GYB003]|uniref:DNA-3-methyladenine glycosylase family protein n=1 Tax=Paenibacillus sp. GYB003 TaxID=2994392 RepID=UPI002F967B38
MELLYELGPAEPRVRRLGEADPQLARLARLIGPLTVSKPDNAFAFLAKSLIGQQLSVKAAATICGRVGQLCGELAPEAILAVSDEALRGAGVSAPKIRYMKGLARHVLDDGLDFARLAGLDDEEVVGVLTKVTGIGRWTAEMFLIFSLGREDVLSLGDAGLRRAASWLYAEEREPQGGSPALERRSERWRPYRTIASLYLWEAINAGHVGAGPLRPPDE